LLKLKSCNFCVVRYGDIVLITIQSEHRKRKVSLPVSQSKSLLNFGRLYGLEKDLGLHGNQFQVAVSILFVTYILSELPSNLVLKKLRPSRWIPFITTAWGIIATLTGITQNYAGLVVCRLFLGAVEGGLFPGTFNFAYEHVRDIF
jgi:MFS family permease